MIFLICDIYLFRERNEVLKFLIHNLPGPNLIVNQDGGGFEMRNVII